MYNPTEAKRLRYFSKRHEQAQSAESTGSKVNAYKSNDFSVLLVIANELLKDRNKKLQIMNKAINYLSITP